MLSGFRQTSSIVLPDFHTTRPICQLPIRSCLPRIQFQNPSQSSSLLKSHRTGLRSMRGQRSLSAHHCYYQQCHSTKTRRILRLSGIPGRLSIRMLPHFRELSFQDLHSPTVYRTCRICPRMSFLILRHSSRLQQWCYQQSICSLRRSAHNSTVVS